MRRILFALLATISLVAAACGGGDILAENLAEKALEGQEGISDVQIDQDGDDFQITVEGDDGESITIGGSDIPDELAIDVPSGGDVISTLSTTDFVTVSLSYPQSEYDSLVTFYENWTASQAAEFSKSTSTYDSGDGMVRTTAWYDDDGTAITIMDCGDVGSDGLDRVCVSLNQVDE